MSLAEHARRELELCGQYAEDPEYSESIIKAVEAFASYGHSGGSAMIAREQLHALLGYKPLSPLTSDPAEWIDQSAISGYPLWQNKRDHSVFSDMALGQRRRMTARALAAGAASLAAVTIGAVLGGILAVILGLLP